MLFLPPGTVACPPVPVEALSDHGHTTLPPEEIAALGDDQAVEALGAARRLRARADALEAHALARLSDLRDEDPYVADEAALELRVAPRNADNRLAQAVELTRRWPRLLEAMRDGEIEAYPASRITDVASSASDEIARAVDARLADKIATGVLSWESPGRLVRHTRKLLLELDPDTRAKNAKQAREQRRMWLVPEEDAMATLGGYLPAEAAAAAYGRIDGLARALRKGGDERNLEQLRADVFADLLLGHKVGVTDPAGAAQVFVHLPIDTALTMSDAGAELSGYGPIPGPIAREIMYQPKSVWRLALTDPRTGIVHDLGRRRYRPSRDIRELIIARDRECVHCQRPAQHCDFDHLRDHARGGATSVANGGARCRRNNNHKNHPRWTFNYHPETGVATTITPAGRAYLLPKQPIIEPEHHRPGLITTDRDNEHDPPTGTRLAAASRP